MSQKASSTATEREFERQLREVNDELRVSSDRQRDLTEQLLISSVRQHELTENAENFAEVLRVREGELAESQRLLTVELAAADQLQGISTEMIGEDEPHALYARILDAAVIMMRARFATIQMLHPERSEMQLLAHLGFSPEATKFPKSVLLAFEPANGSDTAAARVIVPNVEADGLTIDAEDLTSYRLAGISAMQATQLVSRSGQVLGKLSTYWDRPHEPTERDFRLLDVLARQAADLIERNQAEEKLRRSEVKYRALFDSIDQGFVILQMLDGPAGERNYDYRYQEANPAFERQLGLADPVGKTIRELAPAIEEHWMERFGRVADTGETTRFEEHSAAIGRWYDVYAAPEGKPADRRVAVLFDDITERKHREANLAFLAEVSQDLVQLANVHETMDVLCEKIAAHLQASVCAFSDVDENSGTATVQHSWNRADVPNLIGVHRINEIYTEEVARTMRAGGVAITRDASADERMDAEYAARARAGALVSVPLIDAGEWKFSLTIADSSPRDWREDEIELLRELASRIWTRLERARAEQALEQNHKELQRHVDDLGRFNRLAVGRELRMIELKKEINELSRRVGVGEPYPLEFEQGEKSNH